MHQLWFIARRGPGATVAVLAPLRNVIEQVRVELVGDERLTIDQQEIEARHLRLRTEGTGATRDVWLDASGHILQVAIPAAKILAVRDDPPRLNRVAETRWTGFAYAPLSAVQSTWNQS